MKVSISSAGSTPDRNAVFATTAVLTKCGADPSGKPDSPHRRLNFEEKTNEFQTQRGIRAHNARSV
jgi:hypothetical protein